MSKRRKAEELACIAEAHARIAGTVDVFKRNPDAPTMPIVEGVLMFWATQGLNERGFVLAGPAVVALIEACRRIAQLELKEQERLKDAGPLPHSPPPSLSEQLRGFEDENY